MIHNIPQPAFEELVASRLYEDSVEIRKGHSFVECRQVSLSKYNYFTLYVSQVYSYAINRFTIES